MAQQKGEIVGIKWKMDDKTKIQKAGGRVIGMEPFGAYRVRMTHTESPLFQKGKVYIIPKSASVRGKVYIIPRLESARRSVQR